MSKSVRPRLAGLALVAAVTLVAGCAKKALPDAAIPLTTPVQQAAAPAQQTAVQTNAMQQATGLAASGGGNVEIHVAGLAKQFTLMATVDQVASLQVTLSGGSLATAMTQTVSAASLANGAGTITFTDVPPGALTVTITALDASGASIGASSGSATVTAGQTAVVPVSLQLDATHQTNPNGGVGINVQISDGQVVVDPIATADAGTTPSATPTPTPTPTPSTTTGTVDLLGTPTKAWFPAGDMSVSGTVQNTFGVAKHVKVTATFYKKNLLGGSTIADTQSQDLGSVGASSSATFEIGSTVKLRNLWGQEGDVIVTVSTL